jgi:hypothetical protein
MAFMELELTDKGATYSCECARCGATLYTHEWAYMDHNERRDAMQAGTLCCDECCVGTADPSTFTKLRAQYAGRYQAPGYLDCTEWSFGTNKRELERELRSMYAD